jgi:hypothetical protein
MVEHKKVVDAEGNLQASDFGAFYPTGYIVIAFERYEDADQVCQTLRDSGYNEQDCSIHKAEKMAELAQRNLDDTGLLARVGKSAAAVKKHLQAAQQGATFLLVYAPKDDDAERVMNAVGDRPVMLAHRYHHLVIEDLREDEADTHVTSPR